MTASSRRAQLHQIARDYVLKGLGPGSFDAIPYADDVVLRAPLAPGGSSAPLKGRDKLRSDWFAPLPGLVAGVELVSTNVNADETAASVIFLCHIREPRATLRVHDRFKINAAGKITDQENFFDPRDVTNVGWNSDALTSRANLLHKVAREYVTNGLGAKNFDVIPYTDDVELRAPLCPGGLPLHGRAQLRDVWWAPLPGLIASCAVIDTFVAEDLSSCSVEFHCKLANNAVLRVIDTFRVNSGGQIYRQENFFDPR